MQAVTLLDESWRVLSSGETLSTTGKCSKIIPDPAERWQIEKLLLVLEAKLEKHNECHEKK
jgi:hypothetical protein